MPPNNKILMTTFNASRPSLSTTNRSWLIGFDGSRSVLTKLYLHLFKRTQQFAAEAE